MPPVQRKPVQRVLPCWMRVPRRVPSRWIRLHMYRMNRDRYLRSRVVAAAPSSLVIDDLPTEIMVKIFDYVLLANDNEYNIALPRVCSRWTRIMYGFVYVHGFRVDDYDDFLREQLSSFADMLSSTKYNAVVPEHLCRQVLGRYRLGMHPRVITYTILRAEPKEGCEYSIYAAKATQKFCFSQYGLVFEDLDESRQNLIINIFVLEYTQHLFASLRVRLQVALEMKFINRLNIKHLIDSEVSVLNRNTVWHEFAAAIKEGLRLVHEPIDERLVSIYSGPELSAPMRRRIIYLLNNVK